MELVMKDELFQKKVLEQLESMKKIMMSLADQREDAQLSPHEKKLLSEALKEKKQEKLVPMKDVFK